MSGVATLQLTSARNYRLITLQQYNTIIMAAITTINPFLNDVRTAFKTFIHTANYRNRERILYKRWRQMHFFIDDPTLKPKDNEEANLKHRALIKFQLIHNKLYRNADATYAQPRYVVLESEALNLIINEHLQLLHVGRDKVWAAI